MHSGILSSEEERWIWVGQAQRPGPCAWEPLVSGEHLFPSLCHRASITFLPGLPAVPARGTYCVFSARETPPSVPHVVLHISIVEGTRNLKGSQVPHGTAQLFLFPPCEAHLPSLMQWSIQSLGLAQSSHSPCLPYYRYCTSLLGMSQHQAHTCS